MLIFSPQRPITKMNPLPLYQRMSSGGKQALSRDIAGGDGVSGDEDQVGVQGRYRQWVILDIETNLHGLYRS